MAEALSRRWLSTQDLCERYGVKRHTIRNWEAKGKLPKADRTRGRPRWWGPLVEARDAALEPAVAVGSALPPAVLSRVGAIGGPV